MNYNIRKGDEIIEQCNYPNGTSFFGWSKDEWGEANANDVRRVAIFKVRYNQPVKKSLPNVHPVFDWLFRSMNAANYQTQ